MQRSCFLALAVALSFAALPWEVGAQSASPAAEASRQRTQGFELRGTIAVNGLHLFAWLDEDSCAITFDDYDPAPDLIVTDEGGVRVALVPLASLDGKPGFTGTGDNRRVRSCTAEYVVVVPDLRSYRLTIDPYYSESISREELSKAGWVLNIAFARYESDPAPDFHRRPSGPVPGTDDFLIAGTLELIYQESADGRPNLISIPLGGCLGLGGYDDIKAGMQVKITNETETIIAVAEMEPLFTEMNECQFIFSAEVPTANFYTFSIGRRGSLTYSIEEMQAANWRVDFVLGA